MEAGGRGGFAAGYGALLRLRARERRAVGDDELEGSDLILPPPDLTFEEAGREFTGEGLIPD